MAYDYGAACDHTRALWLFLLFRGILDQPPAYNSGIYNLQQGVPYFDITVVLIICSVVCRRFVSPAGT